MRYLIPAFASLMMATSAVPVRAQTPAPATQQSSSPTTAPSPAPVKPNKLSRRFSAANTTHDGHLTLDQARKAKWTQVVRHFGDIDSDKKGYVTEQEVSTAASQARAAKASQKPAPANRT
jgi:hypothetical protein